MVTAVERTEFEQMRLKLWKFVRDECLPAEILYKQELKGFSCQPEIMERLKRRARELGMQNLFLRLSNEQYAPLCELMGWSPKIAPEACNCNAPDTGNMEVLYRFGTEKQKQQYLEPLLRGEIRSAFAMTEPAVASSDATNIQTTIERVNDGFVINGRKWWISNAGHPNLKFYLVLGVSDTRNEKIKHHRYSLVLVPADAPGITRVRPMQVFGYDDAVEGHFEILFENVKIPSDNIIGQEGRGFELIQSRLGPGMAERALALMMKRSLERKTFGKTLIQHGAVANAIAQSRLEINQARSLVMECAREIDAKGNKNARLSIALIKIAVPRMACKVIDRAIQIFGGCGVSQDTPLAEMYAAARCLRIVDGPDDVHMMQVAKMEIMGQTSRL